MSTLISTFGRPYQPFLRARPALLLFCLLLLLLLLGRPGPATGLRRLTRGLAAPVKVSQPVAPDGRGIRPEILALPEVVERRTAHAAVFQAGPDQFRAVFSPAPLHYQDKRGAWQIIDPGFRALEDSYVVEQNSIQSRAGRDRAWFSAVAGEAAVIWDSAELRAVTSGGEALTLATALAEGPGAAEQQDEGRRLHYRGGWSQSWLAEQLVSGPGMLEHLLLLAEAPPAPDGDVPDYLELVAEVQLIPGTTLVVDGQVQEEAFSTAGAVTVFNAEGQAALLLEPIVAYEQGNQATRVAGDYAFWPGEEDGAWMVAVRTPWAWWVDPGRHYPAVLDPVVRRPTPINGGLAGVNDVDGDYGDEILGTGEGPDADSRLYAQFNTMPAALTAAGPVVISGAYLELVPGDILVPPYLSGMGSPALWSPSQGASRPVTLRYLGACPSDARCTDGFSLHDDRLIFSSSPSYNWDNSPTGDPIAVNPLQAIHASPPYEGPFWLAQQGKSLYYVLKPTATRWTVTNEIQAWYDGLYSGIPNPDYYGPTFLFDAPDICPVAGTLFGPDSQFVPACSAYPFSEENVLLYVDFAPVQLDYVGDFANRLNLAGVPSYAPGVLEATAHDYQLQNAAGTQWRAVAARSNHDLVPAEALPLNLALSEQKTGPLGETYFEDITGAGVAVDETAVLFIDEYSPDYSGNDDYVRIGAGGPPQTHAIEKRGNYRVQQFTALPWPAFQVGQRLNLGTNISSDELVYMTQFPAQRYQSVQISVTAPITVQIGLISPIEGMAGGIGTNAQVEWLKKVGEDSASYNIQAGQTGQYGLVVMNTAPPVPTDDGAASYPFEIELLVCEKGELATERYDCQPLVIPSSVVPVRQVAHGGDLINVYSAGGFADFGVNWCTTNEVLGTPMLGLASVVGGSVNAYHGAWMYVGQGRICVDSLGNITTTPDSAVGLSVPLGVQPVTLPDRRGTYGPVMFGQTIIPGSGQQDGEMVLGSNAQFQMKDSNTRRHIQPFAAHWRAQDLEFRPSSNLSLQTVQLTINEVVRPDLFVSGDQSLQAAEWTVSSRLTIKPDTGTQVPFYNYEPVVTQPAALATPTDFASAQLRIIDPYVGELRLLDAYLPESGPRAFQFRNEARFTQADDLGGATRLVQAVAQGPCPDGGNAASCGSAARVDVRPLPQDGYSWHIKNGEAGAGNQLAWGLPDIQITGQAGSVVVNMPGVLQLYSADHPLATTADYGFAFNTWGATVTSEEKPCAGSGPPVTVVEGDGYISLPMMGSDGGQGSAQEAIAVHFRLCQSKLQQASLAFSAPPLAPIPIGSTGLVATGLKGTVTIGPNSTKVSLSLDFRSTDGLLFTDGTGTVTIDTAGLFTLDGSGKLLEGQVTVDSLLLAVAWEPLDVLVEGHARYSDLISGYMRFHAWYSSGWQGKYNWINDNNYHFTGQIGATITVKKGKLIDKLVFKLPPFTLSISAEVAFGEFCNNSSCSPPYPWGMAATVKVFGYKVGVYVDKGGPELIMGSKGKTLIDQHHGTGARWIYAAPLAPAAPTAVQTVFPGAVQPYLSINTGSPFANLSPVPWGSQCWVTEDLDRHRCQFEVEPGTGRALFGAAWQNDNPTISLITPGGQLLSGGSPAHGVTMSTTTGVKQVTFTAVPTTGQTIATGYWQVELDGVGSSTNYFLLHTADAPAPEMTWTAPATTVTPDGNGFVSLEWQTMRGGQALSPTLPLELFYAPVPEPLSFEPHVVHFSGDYLEENGLPLLQAQDSNNDGVWKVVRSDISAGTWQFMAEVSSPQSASYGTLLGEPISFTVASNGDPVHFYYDSRDNTVASRPDSDIPVLIGDMMALLGGGLWDPANLVGWMKPVSGTTHSAVELDVPAGNWSYRVALNEDPAQVYGAGGLLSGPALPLNVPDGGARVRFTYDHLSHEMGHEIAALTPGIPIDNRLHTALLPELLAGSYNWDTSWLASGEYMVGARIDDHTNGNGIVTTWAPGTVVVNDTTPPPVPVVLTDPNNAPLDSGGGLIIAWLRDTLTPDLAGYQIEYQIPDWQLDSTINALDRVRRVLPTPASVDPLLERARLPGFAPYSLFQETTVCVRAFDASGNLSGCSPLVVALPFEPTEELGQPDPEFFELQVPGQGSIEATWGPPLSGTADGYYVAYEPVGCLVPDVAYQSSSGPSPLQHTDLGNLQLTMRGLSQVQHYRVSVRAYNDAGQIGPATSGIIQLVEPGDLDGDGIPDQLEAYYSISDPNADSDGDGLSDGAEITAGSHPRRADSDGDGHYDGSEQLDWQTDPCNSADRPPYHDRPRLLVAGDGAPTFQAAGNQPLSTRSVYQILNGGSGELNWTVATTATWLSLSSSTGNELVVTVDPARLAPGLYTGHFTISTVPGGALAAQTTAVEERVTIPVELSVLYDAAFGPPVPVPVAGTSSGDHVALSWQHEEENARYLVYRSDTPYFFILFATLEAQLDAPAAGYIDYNALLEADRRFYKVVPIGTDGSAGSAANEVGFVRFDLVSE